MKTTTGLLALLACSLAPAHAASYRMAPAEAHTVGSTRSVVAGDFNGDGRDDVALLSQPDLQGRLRVLLQTPSGSLAEPLDFDAWINGRASLAVADFNGDGIDDVIVGDEYGLGYLRLAEEGFERVAIAEEVEACHVLLALDIDGDQAADLACHQSDSEMELLYGDGAGGIRSTASAGTISWVFEMKSGDLNNDGFPDLVVVTIWDDFFVYPGNGQSFDAAIAMPRPSEHHTGEAVAVGDFDGDGLDDFVISGPTSGEVSAWLYRQVPTGFDGPLPLDAVRGRIAMQAADLEGDGDMDIVAASVGQVGWFLQDSDGLGAEQVAEIPPLALQNSLAVGDFNTDGCKDVVVGQSAYQNQLLPRQIVVLHGECPDATSDLDGDARSDLLWRNVATGTNVAWRGADHADQLHVVDMGPQWIVGGIGDFDGDRRDDILWRNTANGLNQIWSAGNRDARIPILNVRDVRWIVAGIGDLDGDGKDDVVWRHTTNGRNQVWLSANARSPQRIFAIRNTDWTLSGVADFDDDGKDDLLWHNGVTGANTIWRGGNPKAQDNITDITDTAWDVAGVGDFDGDGRGDILWRNGADGRNVIWRGGRFDDQQAVRTVAGVDWQVAATGDYDGDGDADIVWRHARSGRNILWRSADPDTQLPITNVLDTDWEIAR